MALSTSIDVSAGSEIDMRLTCFQCFLLVCWREEKGRAMSEVKDKSFRREEEKNNDMIGSFAPLSYCISLFNEDEVQKLAKG